MGYIDTPDKCKRIQEALNEKLDLDPRLIVDGKLGDLSAAAIIKARSVFSLDHIGDPLVDTDLMRELGLLTIQDPAIVGIAAAKGIDLLSLIKLIGLVQSFMKGTATMDSTKPWYTSQTIWASGLAVLGTVLGLFHINFGPADQATVSQDVYAVVTAVSSLWAIVSRIRATKAIG